MGLIPSAPCDGAKAFAGTYGQAVMVHPTGRFTEISEKTALAWLPPSRARTCAG